MKREFKQENFILRIVNKGVILISDRQSLTTGQHMKKQISFYTFGWYKLRSDVI